MRIQNNMMALNTYRQYNIANNATAGYAEKLSSGYQINRAGDDAAGLAISEKMRAQIRGLNMASKNSLDAVSLIQTAEGALQSTHDILQRMRELAVQASSDTNEQVIDRGALDQEFQALKKEIDDTARTTRFNDQNLIDGTFQEAFYSTNISKSQLTPQTIADVSRVGVKSAHNQDGVYKINVEYIAAVETQHAKASYVDMLVADKDKRIMLASEDSKSIISSIDFEAVKTADFNGKTFEVRATAGSGKENANMDSLEISLYDKSTGTTYKGVIESTKGMEGGSVVTVAFDGLGEMKFDIKTNIADTEKFVSNIAEALNSKEIKFVKSAEVITENGATTGLGRNDAYEVGRIPAETLTINSSALALPSAFTNNVSTPGTDAAITASTITITLSDGTTINPTSAALKDYLTTGTDLDAGTYDVELDLGTYGIHTFAFTSAGGANTAVQDELRTFFNNMTINIPEKQPDYTITTRFNAADTVDADPKAANTTLDLSNATLTVNAFDDITVTLAGDTLTNDKTGQAVTTTANLNLLSGDGVADELVYELKIDGYGTFTINIGAMDGREVTDSDGETAPDLDIALLAAINNITQKLGDISEGQENVKGHDAQIALTLNGEMVVVEQNDSRATFDSSGVSLEFRPLDFANVNNSVSATSQFTTKGGTSIEIHVTESEGKALVIQSGANQGDELKINIDNMNTQTLGIRYSDVSTQKTASAAITAVNNAINQVSTQRAALGALQNRLNFKIANLDTSAENLQAAESRIRDTDMAKVMTQFTKSNILGQAATAMLAQANSQPQNVLQLLR